MMAVLVALAVVALAAVAVGIARVHQANQPPRRHTDPRGTRARRGADLW